MISGRLDAVGFLSLSKEMVDNQAVQGLDCPGFSGLFVTGHQTSWDTDS